MCIEISYKGIVRRNRIAYKRVEDITTGSLYRSRISVYSREKQQGYRSTGKRLLYEKGKTVISAIPKTAGIYVYLTKADAQDRLGTLIKVLMLKGARIRYQNGTKRGVACVSKIRVLGE